MDITSLKREIETTQRRIAAIKPEKNRPLTDIQKDKIKILKKKLTELEGDLKRQTIALVESSKITPKDKKLKLAKAKAAAQAQRLRLLAI